MSIFAHIRKSRQKAKEHNAKLAEQNKKESDQAPYKHVPTHAAHDAFASAPPSWREADRPRIVEQNRRRSAMAASGHHMNMPGVPRVGSSLSRVSYPGEDVSVMIRMPRSYSYTGVSTIPGSLRDSREVVYAAPDMTYLHPGSLKGKEVPRAYEHHRISPASSKEEPSSVESLSGSTSSQDDLEIKPSKASRNQSSDITTAHRLHPSRARRTSDVSASQYTLSSGSRGSNNPNYSRDSRPPPSTRGFASIPATATMPPMSTGILSGAAASAAHGSNDASSSTSFTSMSRQNSFGSLPSLSNTSGSQPASAPVTRTVSSAPKSEYPINWLTIPGLESDVPTPSVGGTGRQSIVAGVAMEHNSTPQASHNDSRNSLSTDFQRAVSMRQHIWEAQASIPNHQRMDRNRAPPPVSHEDLVNVFPEQAGSEARPSKSGKSKRLSKTGGGRLVKKNRWSASEVSAVAV
ncbi:hypothetical protein ED733_000615 [Metarhizium rileyi]|nr:hypothetical protein ED733_000615 [Metarhizium rileyi]